MPLVDSLAEALHVLQLPPGASQQEIRSAFKRQALLLHPDKRAHHAASAGDVGADNDAFKRVAEAYCLLTSGKDRLGEEDACDMVTVDFFEEACRQDLSTFDLMHEQLSGSCSGSWAEGAGPAQGYRGRLDDAMWHRIYRGIRRRQRQQQPAGAAPEPYTGDSSQKWRLAAWMVWDLLKQDDRAFTQEQDGSGTEGGMGAHGQQGQQAEGAGHGPGAGETRGCSAVGAVGSSGGGGDAGKWDGGDGSHDGEVGELGARGGRLGFGRRRRALLQAGAGATGVGGMGGVGSGGSCRDGAVASDVAAGSSGGRRDAGCSSSGDKGLREGVTMGVAKETGSVGLGSASDVASVQERQQQQPGRSQWEHGQRQGQWQDQAGARAGACEAGGVANGAARLALVPLSKAETLQGQGHEQRQEQRQEQGQRQEHAQGQRQERAQGQRQGQGSVGTGTHGSAAPQGRRRTTWRFYLTWIRRIVVVKVLTTLLFSSS